MNGLALSLRAKILRSQDISVQSWPYLEGVWYQQVIFASQFSHFKKQVITYEVLVKVKWINGYKKLISALIHSETSMSVSYV